MCWLTATAKLIVFLFQGVFGHNFGLHGLSGETPSGDPMPLVPEITGPFEVKLKLRFNDISSPHHAIFHWTDQATNSTPSSILFAYGTEGVGLWIDDAANGSVECLNDSNSSMSAGDSLYSVQFSADGAALRVFVEDVEVANCASSVVPSDVSRVHFLAESPNSTTTPGIEDLVGAVLGIMVINTNDDPAALAKDTFKFWNFPSQVLGHPTTQKGLAASAYVRFDSLSRSFQRIFDFGNGPANENIHCTQLSTTSTLRCRVFYGVGGNLTNIEAQDSIGLNKWAFWHFEIEGDATFTIRKDLNVVANVSVTNGFPNGVFRTGTTEYIGRGHWASTQNLHGVILGFRLDVEYK